MDDSHEAAQRVVADPQRLAAQEDHRGRAMADTYTLICRPIIDTLRESFES